MRYTPRLMASTALAVLVSAAPLHALPVRVAAPTIPSADQDSDRPLVKVQMSVSEAQAQLEAAMAELTEAQTTGGDVEAAKAKVEAAQAELDAAMAAEAQAAPPAPEQPPAEELTPTEPEPQPAPEEAPAPVEETQPAPEPEAPAAEAPASEEPVPTEETPAAPEAEAPAETTPTEEAPEATAPTEEAPVETPPADDAPIAPTEVAPTEEAPAVPEEPTEPAPATEAPAETAPAEEIAPETAPTQDAPAETVPSGEAVTEEAPAETPPADDAPVAPTEVTPTDEAPAATEAPTEPAPEAEAPADTAPQTPSEPAPETEAPTAEPVPEAEEAPAAPAPAGEVAPQPTETQQEPAIEGAVPAPADSTGQVTPETTLPVEGGAPVLDSAKEAIAPNGEAPAPTGEAPAPDAEAAPQGETAQPPATLQEQAPPDGQTAAPAEPAPIPTNDVEAQAPLTLEAMEIEPVLAEEGRRLEERPQWRPRLDEGQVREVNNRFIIQFNNQTIVENNDFDRIRRRGDVYYEELPGQRTREVITRRNGVQVITIRNRYGEVVRRTKVWPDGREALLVYVPEEYRDHRRPWRDPGRHLPPLRLTIPVSQYVLDATEADPGEYYEFLEQPPVEPVERIYTIEEVKHSARIRDKVRRVDMDTLTFETGSAQIARDQVDELGNVADAIIRILEENPGEMFLIEGHTDAVGSDEANLILSDERAESVANALTVVYGIPPENLATQGYGERYLKVRTEAAERLNRRVTIRRITPLVTPVASAR